MIQMANFTNNFIMLIHTIYDNIEILNSYSIKINYLCKLRIAFVIFNNCNLNRKTDKINNFKN